MYMYALRRGLNIDRKKNTHCNYQLAHSSEISQICVLGQITLNTSVDLLIYYKNLYIYPLKTFVCVEMSVYHHQNVLNI